MRHNEERQPREIAKARGRTQASAPSLLDQPPPQQVGLSRTGRQEPKRPPTSQGGQSGAAQLSGEKRKSCMCQETRESQVRKARQQLFNPRAELLRASEPDKKGADWEGLGGVAAGRCRDRLRKHH
jgi:hypothetical protein